MCVSAAQSIHFTLQPIYKKFVIWTTDLEGLHRNKKRKTKLNFQLNPFQIAQQNKKAKETKKRAKLKNKTRTFCASFANNTNMSLTFGCTARIRLDFIVTVLLSFCITSGCCINWQENVRPKLYVELGKCMTFILSFFFVYLFVYSNIAGCWTFYV